MDKHIAEPAAFFIPEWPFPGLQDRYIQRVSSQAPIRIEQIKMPGAPQVESGTWRHPRPIDPAQDGHSPGVYPCHSDARYKDKLPGLYSLPHMLTRPFSNLFISCFIDYRGWVSRSDLTFGDGSRSALVDS